MITEYDILVSTKISSLVEMTNRFLNDGWEPFGQIVLRGDYILQTIIREKEYVYKEDKK